MWLHHSAFDSIATRGKLFDDEVVGKDLLAAYKLEMNTADLPEEVQAKIEAVQLQISSKEEVKSARQRIQEIVEAHRLIAAYKLQMETADLPEEVRAEIRAVQLEIFSKEGVELARQHIQEIVNVHRLIAAYKLRLKCLATKGCSQRGTEIVDTHRSQWSP
jgi:prophage DNA circulation protein